MAMTWEHVWFNGSEHMQTPPHPYQLDRATKGQYTQVDRFKEMELDLKFVSLGYKGSAIFSSTSGQYRTYHMFPMELQEIIPFLVHGKIKGRFKWVKKNHSTGIKIIVERS